MTSFKALTGRLPTGRITVGGEELLGCGEFHGKKDLEQVLPENIHIEDAEIVQHRE